VDAVRDIRLQVIADGLFHVLMYLLAALGLWMIWRARAGMAHRASGHWLWGSALVAGPVAALPSADASQVIVLFAPGVRCW
jgi:uncharacterized membrane protein